MSIEEDYVYVAQLKIAPEAELFLMNQMIRSCPTEMMFRELIQNAIEASACVGKNLPIEADASKRLTQAHNDQIGLVVAGGIPTKRSNGANKFFLWNNGSGLSAETFEYLSKVGLTGKTQSSQENFGVGSRIAVLASNHKGIRYWSCKDGVVHELLLVHNKGKGENDSFYGPAMFSDDDGNSHWLRVIPSDELESERDRFVEANISKYDSAETRSRYEMLFDTSYDWTAVTLFGMDHTQDTCISPWGEPMESSWFPDYFYHRFFDIPKNVLVRTTSLLTTRGSYRPQKTLFERISNNDYSRHECVVGQNGVKFHYIHDGDVDEPGGGKRRKSYSGASGTSETFGAIMWKGEAYYYLGGQKWYRNAKNYGVPFGYKNLNIVIEIPDDYEHCGILISPNTNRTDLIHKGSAALHMEYFGLEARALRPKWFIEEVEKSNPPVDENSMKQELEDLLKEYRLMSTELRRHPAAVDRFTPDKDGDKKVAVNSDGILDSDKPNPEPVSTSFVVARPDKKGVILAAPKYGLDAAPSPKWVTGDILEDNDAKGMIAYYMAKPENCVLLNHEHYLVKKVADELASRHSEHPDQGLVEEKAMEKAKELIQRLVLTSVIDALGQKILSKDWSDSSIEKAISPEALTTNACKYRMAMRNYHHEMSSLFKLSPVKDAA